MYKTLRNHLSKIKFQHATCVVEASALHATAPLAVMLLKSSPEVKNPRLCHKAQATTHWSTSFHPLITITCVSAITSHPGSSVNAEGPGLEASRSSLDRQTDRQTDYFTPLVHAPRVKAYSNKFMHYLTTLVISAILQQRRLSSMTASSKHSGIGFSIKLYSWRTYFLCLCDLALQIIIRASWSKPHTNEYYEKIAVLVYVCMYECM